MGSEILWTARRWGIGGRCESRCPRKRKQVNDGTAVA